MALAPPTPVAGPARAALPFGLFTAVPVREGSSDRWEAGVSFESPGCPPALKGVGEIACGEDSQIGIPKSFNERGADEGIGTPFTVYEEYVCSPIGNSLERARDMATARLLEREQRRVEEALSTGALGQSPSFTDAVELDPQPTLEYAFGLAEATLATEYGLQGIIHVSHTTGLFAARRGLIETSGQRARTPLGTPVVIGSGYTFDGLYVTPAMFAYRSDIFPSTQRSESLLDRSQNELYGLAERTYVLGMDPCGLWHIAVTPEDVGPTTPEA